MSDCSISWREESIETEGEIIFGNDYVDRLYQDEPLALPDARLDVEDDEETDQNGPFWRLDTCDRSPLNPGNNKKAIFIATRDTVVLTLFSNFRRCKWNVNTARTCSVDICTYGSWTGKMMFDGTTEQISCITQHEDYPHHSERSKRQIVPSSCRRIWEQVSQI